MMLTQVSATPVRYRTTHAKREAFWDSGCLSAALGKARVHQPGFFCHISAVLKSGAVLYILPQEGGAEEVHRNWCKLHPLEHYEHTPASNTTQQTAVKLLDRSQHNYQ